MLSTIIFDFGNVFINLDLDKGTEAFLNTLGVSALPQELQNTNDAYEMGLISTEDFITIYTNRFKHLERHTFIDAWNAILKDFPRKRLDFLKDLKQNTSYQLVLLSNTNTLHIDWIKQNIPFYEAFKDCFDAFYLSHEINLRKPNTAIFNFVLDTHGLAPETCLFIDDNAANIATANQLDIATWHITPYEEDVITLFTKTAHLF